MTKVELRNEVKILFKNNQSELSRLSDEVCRNILESPLYKSCSFLAAYIPLKDEANILKVIRKALEDGKKVAVPKIIPGKNLMDFFYITNFDSDLEIGSSYGILEPVNNLEKVCLNRTYEETLVLCPGRAFTASGKRLGRGKGFYDIYFQSAASLKNLHLCGVCLNFQLFPEIPSDSHDIQMEKVFF